jgi:hypothetical protein
MGTSELAYWAITAHLVGDFVFQVNYMAARKTGDRLVALCHVVAYTACFYPVTRDWVDLAIIFVTHYAIDHWRLAAWWAAFINRQYSLCWGLRWVTQMGEIRTPFFAIICIDQAFHLLCNGFALFY